MTRTALHGTNGARTDANGGTWPLEAVGLTKRYLGGVLALDAVSLDVHGGVITALVGPNAAGKSTLIKAWVGFERPTSGLVRVCGVDPWRQRDEALRHLAYVPQQPALYRSLTVAHHLDMAARIRRGFDLAGAKVHLSDLGIPLKTRPTALSGGQQAQVMLAIAIGTRADVLLLDEPLASLDPLARTEFLAIVRSAVRDRSGTALLASHIVSDIEQVCDRVVVLGVGRVLLDESIDRAKSVHRVVRGSEPPQAAVIGRFSDDGEPISLVRIDASSGPDATAAIHYDPASLDHIVKGYLAAGRMMPGQLRG